MCIEKALDADVSEAVFMIEIEKNFDLRPWDKERLIEGSKCQN